MEFDNKYFNAYYHINKEKIKEENLLTNGTTRSEALKKSQKKYVEKNKERFREVSRIAMKNKYERDNLETLTLRAVRRLFV